MLKIGLVPAEYGSSILVRIDGETIINIIIDGGTRPTFDKFLQREIDEIVGRGEKIDLLVCTHIDDDHIKGLIPLVQKYKSDTISEVWHNGFFQVVDKMYFSGKNSQCLENDSKIIDEVRKMSINTELHDIGITDSISFDACLLEYGIGINVMEKGQALTYKNPRKKVMFGGAEIIIINPVDRDIRALENKWSEEMLSRNYRFSVTDKISLMKSFEIIMSRVQMLYLSEGYRISAENELVEFCTELSQTDHSVTNASSISFIIHYNGKSFLFLGDSVIDEDFVRRLTSLLGHKYKFTGIQLPHHGSRYNINEEFIERYTADEYYVLTDSRKFNHPDITTIANVIVHNREYKKIIFNYPTKRALFFNNDLWMKKYNYEIVVGDGASIVERIY